MDFDLSDEQRLIKDSVVRLMADRYSFADRKKYVAAEEGFSTTLWAQYAELGLLGAPFEERFGGFGGGLVETMIIMEAFGGKLAVEPFMGTIVLGGGLLRHAGSEAQREAMIPQIIEGALTLAFAHQERQARYDLGDVKTRARRDGDHWVIDGEKSLVLNGDSADKLIVSARISGGQRDHDGLALFIVDAKAQGVSRRGYPTQDGLRAAEITFTDVRALEPLGEPGQAFAIISRVTDEAIAALCAEAVGAMSALNELTVGYLKQRKQFGVAIGTFQVLQHRASEMVIALEQARSMAMLATMMAGEDDVDAREKAISAAKVQVGLSGRFVGQSATQLHGGIGVTMEYESGHYFKRLTMINAAYGDVDHHISRLARMGGLFAAA